MLLSAYPIVSETDDIADPMKSADLFRIDSDKKNFSNFFILFSA